MRCAQCGCKECCGADPRMAAADEMYEALERIVYDWDGEPEDVADAQAALAKARGETTGDEE